jgi:hypothetical protein
MEVGEKKPWAVVTVSLLLSLPSGDDAAWYGVGGGRGMTGFKLPAALGILREAGYIPDEYR